MSAHYLIGIDLGTTHCALAFSPVHQPQVHVFPIPQLVAPGQVEARTLLPSFLYMPASGEMNEADLKLPFEGDPYPVGEMARTRGAAVPDRLCSSAKSWICHGGVDRRAKILPWSAEPSEIEQISPLEASAAYLKHLRSAWDAAHKDAPMSEQEIVVTVPASFDALARQITLEAAAMAGLPNARLLEEPQAAFYDFVGQQGEHLAEALGNARLVLVIDLGGGTTDLTLMRIHDAASGEIERIAVGGHLMLGGDNMDAALALELQKKAQVEQLSPVEWSALVQQARQAKEKLLSPDAPESWTVPVAKRGAKLIGSTKTATILREEVNDLLLDGFFPITNPDEEASPQGRAGLTTLGLPYTTETAVPRHLSSFLRRHALSAQRAGATLVGGLPRPDAILLNGGVFKAERLVERLKAVFERWFGSEIPFLPHRSLDTAVACGAVYSSLARHGLGYAISGGSARAYAIGVEDKEGKKRLLCIAPKGLEEGHQVQLPGRVFDLLLDQRIAFSLYASTSEATDPGEFWPDDQPFEALPPLVTVMRIKDRPGNSKEPVTLTAGLTESGTLEVALQTVALPPLRWKLAFDLDAPKTEVRNTPEAQPQSRDHAGMDEPLPKNFFEAERLIERTFTGSQQWSGPAAGKNLRQGIEDFIGPRGEWHATCCRRLFQILWRMRDQRGRTPEHEQSWLRLCGFCMRPGYGVRGDEERRQQIWSLKAEGLKNPSKSLQSEWWIFWRRIAPGLSAEQQEALFTEVRKGCEPALRGAAPVQPELLRLAAVLERCKASEKAEAGAWCLALKKKLGSFWPLGRLGARVLFADPQGELVPVETAEAWLRALLSEDWSQADTPFAAVLLGRRAFDPRDDIGEPLRAELLSRLQAIKCPASWLAFVQVPPQRGDALQQKDLRQMLGEALPSGLRLQ